MKTVVIDNDDTFPASIEDVIDVRFVTRVHSIDYRVAIADFEALGIGDGKEGFFIASKALILIDSAVSPSRRQAVFWHEFVHACFGEMTAPDYAKLVGCPKKRAGESEEELAKFLGPILHASLGKPAIDAELA